jgi:signal transduction histidine kinase
MGKNYPKYQALFELLSPTKSAQTFIILFLIRRALFTGVLLFISIPAF